MNMEIKDDTGQPSRAIRAEAASWVTRLHGPDRDAELERGLKRWLAESRAHARAFELATEVWQETGDLPGSLPTRATGSKADDQGRRYFRLTLAYGVAMGVAVAAVLLYGHFLHANLLTTGMGEQRTLSLADGTRVELNTETELLVRYDEKVRKVVLKAGEAFFDVAKQPRPFIVDAGKREVVALGTAFVVRRDANALSVTMIEGRAAVTPPDSVKDSGKNKAETNVLSAGQRLQLNHAGTASVDVPALEKVTAWQRGQLIFEDTPLSEAVAEFNRYARSKIRLDSTELGKIRVGGTFRVGDLSSFARVVADSHDLEVIDRGEEVVLARIQERAASELKNNPHR
jgi:transmembrane sensor